MAKAVLGVIRLWHLRFAGSSEGANKSHLEPVGRAVGTAVDRRDRRPADRVSVAPRQGGYRLHRPTSITAPISTCSNAQASPIWSRCRRAARSKSTWRPAPSSWSISSSTARINARARSSAKVAWRMSRWRTRCRRGCASILPRPREPKISAWCATAPMCASRARNSRRSPKASPTRISAMR